MPVFSLDNGRLSPARPSLTHRDEIIRETLMAVRDQVVELIYRPIFPVAWLTETSRLADQTRHTSLVALDPTGKTVTVDVVERLDSETLMASLARASRHEEIPSGRMSGLYPRGLAAFRKDWQSFLDSCPPGLEDHPRLIILAVTVEDQVRAALDTLVGASIDVHRIDLHESRSGILVSLEQVRPHEASFLAIGQELRRGEIAPPPHPSDTAATAPDSVEEAADSPADKQDETTESTEGNDGVVFVNRAGDPLDDVSRHSQPEENVRDDGAQGDDEAPAAAKRGAHSAARDSSSIQAETVSNAEQVEDDPEPEFTFHSVGFTADGTGIDAAPDVDLLTGENDDGVIELPEVEWPERPSELRAIASRIGEQTLTFKSLRRRVNASARLTSTGEIVLESGERFTDPDHAASAVAGRRMDGWKNWRTEDGARLGDLR